MGRLLGDGHVLVDHADTSLAGQCDGKRSFRHGVHGGRNDGDVQADITRKTGLETDLARQHFRIGGYKQHIVEGKTFGLHPFIDERHRDADFVARKSKHFFPNGLKAQCVSSEIYQYFLFALCRDGQEACG